MTSRENVAGLISGTGYERVGVFDHFWAESINNWVDADQFPFSYDESGEKVAGDIFDHFNLDMRLIWGPIDHFPLKAYSEIVEETDEWVAQRNGAGAVLKTWKRRTGTPEHIDFRMISRDIWERDYRRYLLELDPGRIDEPAAKNGIKKGHAHEQWTFYGDLFIWEVMRQSLGDFCMYESLLLDPEWILDFGRVYTDFYKAHYGALFERLPKPDGMWIYEDLGYRNGLFCSLDVLERLILPFYIEIVDFFHLHSLPVILHSCGGIEAALPLIVEAGFDGLNPMEVKAGCDIFKFAEMYGDRLVFAGGLDVRIIETGDRDLIKGETIKLINGMKDRGARFLFGSDHSITTAIPHDVYQYLLEIYRDTMWY